MQEIDPAFPGRGLQWWCKQHAPSAVKKRREAWRVKFDKDRARADAIYEMQSLESALMEWADENYESCSAGVRLYVRKWREQKAKAKEE